MLSTAGNLILKILIGCIQGAQFERETCVTTACLESAYYALKYMDNAVDPCIDFYDFACAKFLKESVIKSYKLQENTFSRIEDIVTSQLRSLFIEEPWPPNLSRPYQLLKDTYNLCYRNHAENDGLRSVEEIVVKLGSWPLIEGEKWNANNFDWVQMMVNFNQFGIPYPYLFETDVQAINNSKFVIYLVTEEFSPAIKIKNRLYDIVRLFNLNLTVAQQDVESIMSLKDRLELIKKDPFENNEIMTNVIGLQKIGVVDWIHFFKGILGTHDNIDSIMISTPYKIVRLVSLLSATPKRTLANYVFFETVLWMFHYAEDKLRYIGERISGRTPLPPRWYDCVQDMYGSIDLPLYSLYVKKYLSNDTKQEVEKLVTTIRSELLKQITASKWLDESTKSKAIEKANAMQSYVGYPSELGDSVALEMYYEKLNIDTTSYLKSIMRIKAFNNRKQFDKLFQPTTKSIWESHIRITDINAYYYPSQNSIDITAAILQKVYFNKDRPSYMNYAQIGMIIGHEIMHGFDNGGKNFDKNGNLHNWWTDTSSKIFNDKAQCIVNQYAEYTFPGLKLKIDGLLTLNENIADNIGVHISYLSYKTWMNGNGSGRGLPGLNYTRSQLFWIAFAQAWCEKLQDGYYGNILLDNHSPPKYRVIGSLSNLKEFAQDFKCPLDSPMNPSKKCTLW